jgi:hypothetical protein
MGRRDKRATGCKRGATRAQEDPTSLEKGAVIYCFGGDDNCFIVVITTNI